MGTRTRASSPSHMHYARYIQDILASMVTGAAVRPVDNVWLVPVQIPFSVTIDALGCIVDTAVGNLRLALYRDNGDLPDGGALIVESGSQVAVYGKNEFPIANTQLAPGLYWLALQNDNGACIFILTHDTAAQTGTLIARSVFPHGYGAFPNPCPATNLTTRAPTEYVRVVSSP